MYSRQETRELDRRGARRLNVPAHAHLRSPSSYRPANKEATRLSKLLARVCHIIAQHENSTPRLPFNKPAPHPLSTLHGGMAGTQARSQGRKTRGCGSDCSPASPRRPAAPAARYGPWQPPAHRAPPVQLEKRQAHAPGHTSAHKAMLRLRRHAGIRALVSGGFSSCSRRLGMLLSQAHLRETSAHSTRAPGRNGSA